MSDIDIAERLYKAIVCGDFPYRRDEAGKLVFHSDVMMEEAAAEIASLRQQLSEARADKRMVDDLLTAAVDDYNDAIGEIKARSDAYEHACRERDEARAKALEDAIDAVKQSSAHGDAAFSLMGPMGILSRACAAIRSLMVKPAMEIREAKEKQG